MRDTEEVPADGPQKCIEAYTLGPGAPGRTVGLGIADGLGDNGLNSSSSSATYTLCVCVILGKLLYLCEA